MQCILSVHPTLVESGKLSSEPKVYQLVALAIIEDSADKDEYKYLVRHSFDEKWYFYDSVGKIIQFAETTDIMTFAPEIRKSSRYLLYELENMDVD